MEPLAPNAVMKVVSAVALLALLAPIASACGSADTDTGERHRVAPGSDARRLPATLDLDRLAGMEMPGTPHCRFDNQWRTFLGKAFGTVSTTQELYFNCREDTQWGTVRSGDGVRWVPEEPRCANHPHRSMSVDCIVRHERLSVSTDASCSHVADVVVFCGDDGEYARTAETKARAMMARVIELLEPLPQEATPALGIDPTALPPTVDLGRLAGRSFVGTQFGACAFDDDPLDHAGTGTAAIGLRCGSSATGIVEIDNASVEAIDDAGDEATPPVAGPSEDIVECSRDARQSECDLHHGMVHLSTTLDCSGGCGDGATPSALIALVAKFLATRP